jgi:hypothetical protein
LGTALQRADGFRWLQRYNPAGLPRPLWCCEGLGMQLNSCTTAPGPLHGQLLARLVQQQPGGGASACCEPALLAAAAGTTRIRSPDFARGAAGSHKRAVQACSHTEGPLLRAAAPGTGRQRWATRQVLLGAHLARARIAPVAPGPAHHVGHPRLVHAAVPACRGCGVVVVCGGRGAPEQPVPARPLA